MPYLGIALMQLHLLPWQWTKLFMAIDQFETHKQQIGRTDWNFNFLFDKQPQVAELAARYQPHLQHPGLHKPVPAKWLHATLLRVGFVEDFAEPEMLEVADGLGPKLAATKLPSFILGQWWLWGGNPCLHITPDDPLRALFRTVVKEVAAVVGPGRLPSKLSFTPHVTLAYSKTYDDELGLYRQLEERPLEGVDLHLTSVALIKQRIVDDYYAWEVVRELPIGQG